MSCGAAYRHLLPEPPGALEPGWSAYGTAKAAADRVFGYVRAADEAVRAKGSTDDLGEAFWLRLQGYYEAYAELPSSTWVTTTPDAQLVKVATANAEDGACMLELLDAHRGASDVPAKSPQASGFNLTTTAALLSIAWIAYQFLSRKEAE